MTLKIFVFDEIILNTPKEAFKPTVFELALFSVEGFKKVIVTLLARPPTVESGAKNIGPSLSFGRAFFAYSSLKMKGVAWQ